MDEQLPIFKLRARLADRLKELNRLILVAPTGSGKTTQVPQMLLADGALDSGRAIILQPRRLAARLLAARVAEELGEPPGRTVGYQVRFADVSSSATRIKFVTEGILLRHLLSNPRLDGVSTLIFDEFHERHIHGDLSLAMALELQGKQRPDLKIIVMSATLDAGKLREYLAPCDVLAAEGRVYPVRVDFLPGKLPTERPVWETAAQELDRVLRAGAAGDALIFMPGAYEIQRTLRALQDFPATRGLLALPLHGELAPRDQDSAVARYSRRKVVVATNVAETSLTIAGIGIVIDSGLARQAKYDPWRGINTLLIDRISRASADQRAGRAGRTMPGLCVRLWTEHDHASRPAHETPEIRRVDLAEALLLLKANGIPDPAALRWLDPPEPRALERAEELLRNLGAADEHTGGITPIGRRMISFPTHPRYARMLLAAEAYGCVREAALIAALTQERNLLLRGAGGTVKEDRDRRMGEESESDFFRLMDAWRHAADHDFELEYCRRLAIHAHTARQIGPLYDHLTRIAEAQGLPLNDAPADRTALRKCILAGFADHLAMRLDRGSLRCQLLHNRRGNLSRESVVQDSPLLVAAEVQEIGGRAGEVNVMLNLATAVERDWLAELFPEDLRIDSEAVLDPETRRATLRRTTYFRDLPLETRAGGDPTPELAARLLADKVLSGEFKLPEWNDTVDQFFVRLQLLREHFPEMTQLPASADLRLQVIEALCQGAYSHKEIKDRPVLPILRNVLPHATLAFIEKQAPERWPLPNGRSRKIQYTPARPPTLSATIQDLFGITATPRIAGGRVALLVEILAPNQRPVQTTQDLAAFWRERYPVVKKELQRKYPRHEWK